jgi:hypothetical protein
VQITITAPGLLAARREADAKADKQAKILTQQKPRRAHQCFHRRAGRRRLGGWQVAK